MTAPPCLECPQPVKRAHGHTPPSRHYGVRVVDGIRWRWFCSTTCSAKNRIGLPMCHAQIVGLLRARQTRDAQKLLARLIEAAKADMDADGKVPIKAMVKVLAAEIRRERQNAACRRYLAKRHTVAA
jgi:hypothetical protein